MEACPGPPVPAGAGTHGPSPYQVSLILLTRNREATIRQAIRAATAALPVTAAFEVVVVDDASSDGTAEAVRAEAAADPRVRLVQLPHCQGAGAALRAGLTAATRELVVLGDTDARLDPDTLAYLLPLARTFGLVCGYRLERPEPAPRRLLSWGYSKLAGLLLGIPTRDLGCGLKVGRREALAGLLPEDDGDFAPIELVARARMQGLQVVEVPLRQGPPLAPPPRPSWRAAARALTALLTFWWARLLFPAPEPARARKGWLWAGLPLLALVSGLLLFPNLAYPLVEPDEGRYAEISREMLASGDWVVPTLNRSAYLDKPPLFYWTVAGSYALFGVSDGAARLVPALAAFGIVLLTFLFARRVVGERAALLAGLIVALTPGLVQCGRYLVLDSFLSLWVTAALLTGQAALGGDRLRRGWWAASAVCCGLGILTKGPVALVLAAPPLAAYAWLSRCPVRPTRRQWAGYVGLAVGLATPWYAAVLCRKPGFAYSFFVEHHLQRFFGEALHGEPAWYYAPVLLIFFLPWSVVLVPCVRFLFSRSAALAALRPRGLGLFVLSAGWCLLFFSLSRGKLPPYILPALPALAVLIGCFLDQALFSASSAAFFRRARAVMARVAVGAVFGAGLGVSLAAWPIGLFGPALALALAGVCAGALATLEWWGRWLPAKAAWLLCGVLGAAVLLELTHGIIPAYAGRRAALTPGGAAVRLAREQHVPVVCFGGDWWSVPFYARSSEPVPSFDGEECRDLLQTYLKAHPRVLFVLRHRDDRRLFQALVPADWHLTTVQDVGEGAAVLAEPIGAAK